MRVKSILSTVFSGAVIAAALFFADSENETWQKIIYCIIIVLIFVGFDIIFALFKKKNPEKFKKYVKEENDERNIALRGKACFAAWNINIYVLIAALIALIILNYSVPIMIIIGVMFVNLISFIITILYYNKKM